MKICKKSLALALAISLFVVMISVMSFASFAESSTGFAKFKAEFINEDGTFNTSAEGFPSNYQFDFTDTLASSEYKMKVPKKFFRAAKLSGQTVVIIDSIGLKYVFKPENIGDSVLSLSGSDLEATVSVGGRYRATKGYGDAGNKIASDNMGIPASEYVHKINFGFIQLESGQGIASTVEIRAVMNFGDASDTATANLFYNYAKNNKLYVYQYVTDGQKINPDRAVEKAKALTAPEFSFNKAESAEMQFLFSDRPLRQSDVESVEEIKIAPYREDFVSNGQFVTTAEGFPTTYTFTLSSYTAEKPGIKKDFFQAVKNSGRIVTLIDNSGINYVFDGSKMSDVPAAERNEYIQVQALWKNNASYQTVAGEIAKKGKIRDGFFINEDYVILDMQPVTTNVGITINNNSFPSPATVVLDLTGGVSGNNGKAVAAKFLQYAKEGKLKAFFYDKTSTVQDLFLDKQPLVPTVTDDDKITFTIQQPCTLIFTHKDLLTKRFIEEDEDDTDPYKMRIKKDGKNMSDGYTIELGDIQYFELSMMNGDVNDFEFIWDVIGPGADTVKIEPVEGSNNLVYKVTPLKVTGKAFQVRVRIVGQEDIFVTTGTTTIIDTVYGKDFVENGKFNTSKTGFPSDYVFKMSGDQYQITGAFLNAIAESKKDVVIVDTSNIRYIFHGAEMDLVPEDEWDQTHPVKALYKDSEAYQGAIRLVAYQYGITDDFVNNKDYIIIDFQAHNVDLPLEVDCEFKLEAKARSADIAKHFADAYREGKLYVYAYSKTTQSIYKPLKDLVKLIDGTDTFTMKLQSPMTIVFSTSKLMDDLSDGENNEDPGNGNDTDNGEGNTENPTTGDSTAVLPIALLGISSAAALTILRKKVLAK